MQRQNPLYFPCCSETSGSLWLKYDTTKDLPDWIWKTLQPGGSVLQGQPNHSKLQKVDQETRVCRHLCPLHWQGTQDSRLTSMARIFHKTRRKASLTTKPGSWATKPWTTWSLVLLWTHLFYTYFRSVNLRTAKSLSPTAYQRNPIPTTCSWKNNKALVLFLCSVAKRSPSCLPQLCSSWSKHNLCIILANGRRRWWHFSVWRWHNLQIYIGYP